VRVREGGREGRREGGREGTYLELLGVLTQETDEGSQVLLSTSRGGGGGGGGREGGQCLLDLAQGVLPFLKGEREGGRKGG